MPIRLNLLAEAQAAEELRRKDPVKRGIWVGVFLVLSVLVWSSSLRIKLMTNNMALSRLQASLSSRTNQYDQILSDQKKLEDVRGKLAALDKLAINRFLYGDFLSGVMHTTTEGVQLLHLRLDQNFSQTEGEKPTKSATGAVIPGKPAGSVESLVLLLDARDTSPNPGTDNVDRYKNNIAHSAYFQSQNLTTDKIRLTSLSAPQVDTDSGLAFVLLSFECRYPDIVLAQ